MTFTQLRAFATVARLGSVSAAAAALGVTEPAVSAAVASLRRDLGDPLFHRAAGGVRLSPGGERLAAAAAEILGLEDRMRREVRAARGEHRLLRLAVSPPVAEYVSAPLLDAFTRRWPALEVSQEVAAPRDFGPLLTDRRADVVLGPGPGPVPGLQAVPFLRYKLVVVASPRHRLAGARDVRLSALRGERWLVGPAGEDLERLFAGAGGRGRVARARRVRHRGRGPGRRRGRGGGDARHRPHRHRPPAPRRARPPRRARDAARGHVARRDPRRRAGLARGATPCAASSPRPRPRRRSSRGPAACPPAASARPST